MLVGSCTGFVANRMLANYSSEVMLISILLPILICILTKCKEVSNRQLNTNNYRSRQQSSVAQFIECLTGTRRFDGLSLTSGGVMWCVLVQDTLSTSQFNP